MSIGQRIAQKRKEAGLSQEALGEQMGVSRQSIYKWESDAALPEIEKLITLSKLFGVSVGWLLGLEEAVPEAQNPEALSQTQLDLVEEIVGRYIQAKPRRRWPKVVAALVLVAVGIGFAARLDQIQNQYNNLQNSMNMIDHSVHSQINGITGRVEAILKAQNSLTAEYGTKILSTDYAGGTVTIAMEAVPKTHQPEMSAVFVIDCGGGPQEFGAELTDGRSFTAEATVPLSDSITVAVAFVQPDGTRQNQLLDSYSSLLSSSYAQMWIDDFGLNQLNVVDGALAMKTFYITARPSNNGETEITAYKVGIFRNRKLIAWGEPCEKPANYYGDYTERQFFRLPDLVIQDLKHSDRLCIAALVTDSYGRQYMCQEMEYVVYTDSDGEGHLSYPNQIYLEPNPEKWIFE